MHNRAIINAAKIAIKQAYMPKSLRGKVKLIVTNKGIEIINIKKKWIDKKDIIGLNIKVNIMLDIMM